MNSDFPKPLIGLYNRYSDYLVKRFGFPVRKVTVDAGFSCPNRDGSKGTGGCRFCNNAGFNFNSPQKDLPVAEQLAQGISRMKSRYPDSGWLAYFQAYSNTYADAGKLRKMYEDALGVDGVVGLAIGTRPDCLPEEVIGILEEFAARSYIQLEIGLQSANDESLKLMNRGHLLEDYLKAMDACRGRGLVLCGHMIVGLPGETVEDAKRTAEIIAGAGARIIKIHNLHLVKGSSWGDLPDGFRPAVPELEEYADIISEILQVLPPDMVVERLWGNAPRELLIAPEWCLDGNKVKSAIEKRLIKKEAWQGKKYSKELL